MSAGTQASADLTGPDCMSDLRGWSRRIDRGRQARLLRRTNRLFHVERNFSRTIVPLLTAGRDEEPVEWVGSFCAEALLDPDSSPSTFRVPRETAWWIDMWFLAL